nr:NADH-plastoquinone oxidoreductase subunit 6 [Phalaenopsis stobartiana]
MSHKVHWTKFHNYLIPYKEFTCNYSISLVIFLESFLILGGLGIVLLTNPIDSAFSLVLVLLVCISLILFLSIYYL